MVDREDVRDDLAAYALGALEPGERLRVEAALRSSVDREAAQLLDEYAAVRDLLPYGVAPQEAPAGARARLLARARGGVHARERPGRTVWQRLRDALSPLRWAVVAVVLSGVVAWNVQLQQQLLSTQSAANIELRARATQGPGIPLVGTGAVNAAARLYVGPDAQRAELAIVGLVPLAPGRTYQLWFARPGQPTETGGAFRVDERGQALVPVVVPVPLDQVSAIAVTEEPMPASLRPTGQHLLDGRPAV
jgi:anti-sigma-K factor RskA